MKNVNRKNGNDFEKAFCETLYKNGFWVHNFAQKASGQPADIIAVRNKEAHLIDCKVCSKRGFVLERMEENQDLSMTFWKDCGNGNGWFAILLDGSVYMIPHVVVAGVLHSQSAFSPNDIREFGFIIDRWIAICT